MSDKRYVRSFLMYMRIDSVVAKLSLLTKLVMALAISIIVTRMIGTNDLDPLGIMTFLAVILVLLFLSGSLYFIFRSRFAIIFFALTVIFMTWIIFNPVEGGRTFVKVTLFPGFISASSMVYSIACLAAASAIYRTTRSFFYSAATYVGLLYVVNSYLPDIIPGVALRVSGPITLTVSEKSLFIAGTKVLGYGTMILATLLLLVTTRDVELVEFLRRLGLPFKYSFFMSLFFRTLSSALMDYTTIRQAQISRGIALKRKNIFETLRDFAMLSIPLIITSIRRGSEIGMALSARGFSLSIKRVSEFREHRRPSAIDVAIISSLVALSMVVWALDLNVTELVMGLWT